MHFFICSDCEFTSCVFFGVFETQGCIGPSGGINACTSFMLSIERILYRLNSKILAVAKPLWIFFLFITVKMLYEKHRESQA